VVSLSLGLGLVFMLLHNMRNMLLGLFWYGGVFCL
jgi:hypothetical protein